MSLFRGAYTALVTPFSADGRSVDLDRLADQVRHQASGGVQGVVPCGTTGESPTLTEHEVRDVITRTIEVCSTSGLQVIAGTGSNSTRHAVELHRFAHGAGADGSLQVVPYYSKPTQEGLYRHFMAVADSCELPVVLYNIPGRSAVGLSLETIERLAAHPNIVAVKEATGTVEYTDEIVRRTDLTVLSGDDPLTLALCAVGATGVISVVSNLVPDRVSGLCRAIQADDLHGAREAHAWLAPLSRGLLSLATNPIPVKTAMAIVGRDTGVLRLPLCPPEEAVRRRIGDLLAACGLRAEVTV
jgi:4-hydroxy-tetrahydrodipicolinate synthase